MAYQCDCCGRMCSRIHRLVAYGTDTSACDDCMDYDYAAYDEDRDFVLHPIDPREEEDEARRRWWDQHRPGNEA